MSSHPCRDCSVFYCLNQDNMVDPAVAGEEGRIVCPKQHQSETKKEEFRHVPVGKVRRELFSKQGKHCFCSVAHPVWAFHGMSVEKRRYCGTFKDTGHEGISQKLGKNNSFLVDLYLVTGAYNFICTASLHHLMRGILLLQTLITVNSSHYSYFMEPALISPLHNREILEVPLGFILISLTTRFSWFAAESAKVNGKRKSFNCSSLVISRGFNFKGNLFSML